MFGSYKFRHAPDDMVDTVVLCMRVIPHTTVRCLDLPRGGGGLFLKTRGEIQEPRGYFSLFGT